MNLSDHLDKLEAFKVIAESRTMREAALKLNVSQPSLTKLMQTLELATGVELISRGRQGVSPTESGKRLLQYANSTLKELQDLEQKLQNPLDQLTGHLRIGAYASLAEYLWPHFIPFLKKRAPALKISIYTSETYAHQLFLERGEIDILVDAEPRLAGDLISWKLYEDRFNFYVRTGKKEFLNSENIEDLPLIYSPNACDHEGKKIIQHLEENGFFFKERMEFDSFMAVLAFAKKGLGVAVLPNRLADASSKEGLIRPLALKNFQAKGFGAHHFAATILENRKDDPRLRFLIQCLREWLKT